MWILALALAVGVDIRDVRCVTGSVFRAGEWTPFEIVLTSSEDLEGTLGIRWEGIQYVFPIRLSAAHEQTILVAGVFPDGPIRPGFVVESGGSVRAARTLEMDLHPLREEDRLIGIEASHPRAAELDQRKLPIAVGGYAYHFRFSHSWETNILPIFEACDVLVTQREPKADLRLWKLRGGTVRSQWAVGPVIEEEIPRVRRIGGGDEIFFSLDARSPWIRAKTQAATLLLLLYLLLVLVVFGAWSRPRFPAFVFAVLMLAGAAFSMIKVFYPFGSAAATFRKIEVHDPALGGGTLTLVRIQSQGKPCRLFTPLPVRPVFPSYREALLARWTYLIQHQSSGLLEVGGWPKDRTLWFLDSEAMAVSPIAEVVERGPGRRVVLNCRRDLGRPTVLVSNFNRSIHDLRTGERREVVVSEDEAMPEDPLIRLAARLFASGGDFLFGMLDSEDFFLPVFASPDLCEQRHPPRRFVQALR